MQKRGRLQQWVSSKKTTSNTEYTAFSALVGVGILVVVELVEDDSQPVELGQRLDAIGKHGFADHYHLEEASLQTALHSLIDEEERRGEDAGKRPIFNLDQL